MKKLFIGFVLLVFFFSFGCLENSNQGIGNSSDDGGGINPKLAKSLFLENLNRNQKIILISDIRGLGGTENQSVMIRRNILQCATDFVFSLTYLNKSIDYYIIYDDGCVDMKNKTYTLDFCEELINPKDIPVIYVHEGEISLFSEYKLSVGIGEVYKYGSCSIFEKKMIYQKNKEGNNKEGEVSSNES